VDFLEILALTITIAALFSYLNHRWVRLPRVIGLMLMGATVSVLVAVVGRWLPNLQRTALVTLGAIDFERLVLHGVLGILLFAGALHLDLDDLRRHAAVITVLSTVGVVLSTVIVGWLMWRILGLLGLPLPLLDCLLFGALISPTDPIAVIAVLRDVSVPSDVAVQLAGESLFNDCMGVVLFLALLRLASHPDRGSAMAVVGTGLWSLQETVGGILFGAVMGIIAFALIKTVDDYRIEILLSLALVLGGWALAERIHVSAPMATVVAGLLIGNHGRVFAMSRETRERLDVFWEVVEEILNAVLFILIGLQLLTIEMTGPVLIAGGAAIGVALLARWLSIGAPLILLRRFALIATPGVRLMTWAGVRGPLSIALALSLPPQITAPGPTQTSVVVMTYAVVIFSVVVQGLTLKAAVGQKAGAGRR
jgi:CPA1 family monovalent cation:H+ antiporter